MENLRVRYSLKDQSMNFPFQNTTTIYKPQYKKDLFGFEKKRQKLCSFLKKTWFKCHQNIYLLVVTELPMQQVGETVV